MAVPVVLNDIEEYSLRTIAVLGGNMHSQITVGNVTLPKAVLSTVKIFAVYHRTVTLKTFQQSRAILVKQKTNFLCI